jgi:hypothetical protein
MLVVVVAVSNSLEGATVRLGFDGSTMSPGDDHSVGPVAIGFEIDFFGQLYSQVYLNNNGNITFHGPFSTFTPSGLSTVNVPIIAPFFADVDTSGGVGVVTYGVGSVGGRDAWAATWTLVGHYLAPSALRNTFQVVIIERFDTGTGNFDLEFNYDQIQWETGDASNGVGGLGGSSATIGYSAGTGVEGTYVEIPGSGVNGAFLDSNPNGLVNSGGGFVLQGRGGEVVPEPNVMVLTALTAGLALGRRRR